MRPTCINCDCFLSDTETYLCAACILDLQEKREARRCGSVSDPVNPAHYQGDYVMRIIENFKLGFCLGNVVKYVLRSANKNGLEDLKKSRWYLEREISNREKGVTKS